MTPSSPYSEDRMHHPVMLREVLDTLAPCAGGAYVDGTFGAGGYSEAILAAADCRVWAIDRDPDAILRGHELAERYPGRITILAGRFGDMEALLAEAGVDRVNGVVLDLGLSSPQVDTAERGFSFRTDGPLDMRMERTGETAADVINRLTEKELTGIIRTLGEERFAARIARAIVRTRAKQPITRTGELADIVRGVLRRADDGIDPATRTFQALRIYVNDELGELDRGLFAAERLLAPGGRLVVVAFHSLEDRRVKLFMRVRSGGAPRASRHTPEAPDQVRAPSLRLLTRSPLRPQPDETAANPRARSAKLRAAERTDAPPWPANEAA